MTSEPQVRASLRADRAPIWEVADRVRFHRLRSCRAWKMAGVVILLLIACAMIPDRSSRVMHGAFMVVERGVLYVGWAREPLYVNQHFGYGRGLVGYRTSISGWSLMLEVGYVATGLGLLLCLLLIVAVTNGLRGSLASLKFHSMRPTAACFWCKYSREGISRRAPCPECGKLHPRYRTKTE